MLSYEIDASILTLRTSGALTVNEREAVFDAVRADARVPLGALVLIDARQRDLAPSEFAVVERLRVLLDQLGPKLGPVCAVVVPAGPATQWRIFQDAARGAGLQVALFIDEPSARLWLEAPR
jgi:hypothetical protein